MRVYLRAFFVGSAFPVTVWPFLYLGLSFTFNPNSSLMMGLVPILLPVVMGVANVLYIFSEKNWPSNFSNGRLWLFGALYGLFLSIYGNFVSNVPTDLFLLSGLWQYLTIPAATFVYALIWRYIIKHLNRMVGIAK